MKALITGSLIGSSLLGWGPARQTLKRSAPADASLLEDVDGVVAQHDRVAEILERQRVLGEAGLAGEARHVAERDHEVVVLEEELPPVGG